MRSPTLYLKIVMLLFRCFGGLNCDIRVTKSTKYKIVKRATQRHAKKLSNVYDLIDDVVVDL